jgi:hypothetical protein
MARLLGQPGMESQLGFDTGISKSLLLTSARVGSKMRSQELQLPLAPHFGTMIHNVGLTINSKEGRISHFLYEDKDRDRLLKGKSLQVAPPKYEI